MPENERIRSMGQKVQDQKRERTEIPQSSKEKKKQIKLMLNINIIRWATEYQIKLFNKREQYLYIIYEDCRYKNCAILI